MADFFSRMNQEYVQKHFPGGSVFEGAMKTVKRRSAVAIFFFGIFFIAGLCGLVWSIGRTMEFMSNGEDDMLGVGIVICAFFGLIVLGTGALLYVLYRGGKKKRNDYITSSAKNSKLPESDIQAFEQQAVASDCYILKMTAGLDRVLSNATNKDGLLTRDYIYLADPAQTVMRVADLKACCFGDYTYRVDTGKSFKKIHCLVIYLIASNGISIMSDTTETAGQALMTLLKERNGAIDTNDGKVLPENAFSDYKKRILGEK